METLGERLYMGDFFAWETPYVDDFTRWTLLGRLYMEDFTAWTAIAGPTIARRHYVHLNNNLYLKISDSSF